MTAPIITVKSVSRSKISSIAGVSVSVAEFTADQPLVDWEARADGGGVGQGLLVGNASDVRDTWDKFDGLAWSWDFLDSKGLTWDDLTTVLAPNQVGIFEVESDELTNGDKEYRINIYGKNKAGEWSSY